MVVSVLYIAAFIFFIGAAIGVGILGHASLVPIGLACLVAGLYFTRMPNVK